MSKQIAVLLPHFNNHKGLKLTLNSLLTESEDFTVFIYDDASDDLHLVKEVISEFKKKLKIVFFTNPHMGITKVLNKGLKHIVSLKKYAFIARLDAGDICLNNRLTYQKEAFLKETNLGLVASWVRFVDVNRKQLFDFKPPSHHKQLKKVIHLYNPFIHPSVMYRVEVIEKLGLYPENYPCLEDHAFFFNIISKYKTTVLKSFLLEYEINPEGISAKNRKQQTKSRIKLLLNQYKFGFLPTLGLFRAILTNILPQRILILMKVYFFK